MGNLPPQVNQALALLEGAGFEAFLVGGAVRDLLRGVRDIEDWDVATNARPEQIRAAFAGWPLADTGGRHGTVTVGLDGQRLEITPYRVEAGYSDHRHPDTVRFVPSLREDLARRDFTVNALAYHPRTGVIDLVGGQRDLARGLIRCVGEPEARFREDGLRILRALRFAATLSFRIEGATARGMERNRVLLAELAVERVRDELTGLLCGPAAGPVVARFWRVLAGALPELAPPILGGRGWRRVGTALAALPPQPALRWAALLWEGGGPSGVLAEGLLARLRLDRRTRAGVLRLLQGRAVPIQAGRKPLRRLASQWGAEAAGQLIALQGAFIQGSGPWARRRRAELQRAGALLEGLLGAEDCLSLRELAVNGHDLTALGLQGLAVGRALQACLEAVLEEQVANDRTELLAFVRSWRGIDR